LISKGAEAVHQHIDPRELRDERVDAGPRGDVGGDAAHVGASDRSDGANDALAGTAIDVDRRAFAREPFAMANAIAGRRARDEGDLSVESEVHEGWRGRRGVSQTRWRSRDPARAWRRSGFRVSDGRVH
jgi:hypothetical protein